MRYHNYERVLKSRQITFARFSEMVRLTKSVEQILPLEKYYVIG